AFEHGPEAAALRPLSGSAFGAAPAEEIAALERPRMRVAGTFGVDRTTFAGEGDLVGTVGQVRSLIDAPLHRMVRVRAGVDVLTEEHRLELAPASERPENDDGSFAKAFPNRTVGTLGAFADLGLRPWPFLEIVGGLRVDYFGDPNGDAVGVDPRANARIALFPWLRSVTTFGIAHQRPAFVLAVPGAAPADRKLILQQGMQMSQGLEADLPFHMLL